MTGDNSHCTKTAHVKREGREAKERGKKKKGGCRKKIFEKSHATPPCCLAGPRCAGMRTCPNPPTPGMQKLAPWQGPPPSPAQPPVHPAEQEARKAQGHPLSWSSTKPRGGWVGTAQPPRREAEAPHRGRVGGRARGAGHRTGLAHRHPRGSAEIMAKSGFFSATLGPLASSHRAWAEL